MGSSFSSSKYKSKPKHPRRRLPCALLLLLTLFSLFAARPFLERSVCHAVVFFGSSVYLELDLYVPVHLDFGKDFCRGRKKRLPGHQPLAISAFPHCSPARVDRSYVPCPTAPPSWPPTWRGWWQNEVLTREPVTVSWRRTKGT